MDFAGKRVAVIGTGSTGIQVIQEIANEAAELTVFQRTPNFAAPSAMNPSIWRSGDGMQSITPSCERARAQHMIGVPYDPPSGPAHLQRRRMSGAGSLTKYWDRGGFRLLVSTFSDVIFNQQANETIAEYIRERIRERVKILRRQRCFVLTDHPYASKRPPFETGYYEAYNPPHVHLVDVRSAPIEAITPTGVRTSSKSYEFDVIITRNWIRCLHAAAVESRPEGRDGLTRRQMGERPELSGCPDRRISKSVRHQRPEECGRAHNVPLATEDNVNFVAAALARAIADKTATFEATYEAEEAWGPPVRRHSQPDRHPAFQGLHGTWARTSRARRGRRISLRVARLFVLGDLCRDRAWAMADLPLTVSRRLFPQWSDSTAAALLPGSMPPGGMKPLMSSILVKYECGSSP